MNEKWILRAVLFAAAVAAVAFAATRLRETHDKISLNVDEIEDQIAGLDAVTRAGVVARLTADAAKTAHERTGH
jgi:O-glycosyl hydrolase